jgi:aminobenzoyl-glutamate transport protein
MPYFPLILIFCQRWQKEFGLGSLVATMLPYSMTMLFAGILMTVLWVVLGIPLGPNSPVGFSL